jgi:hypothetical protein
LLKANAPAVPSVFHNTPPADAEDEALRTAPEDWRAQTAEQKAAINQFHIARIAGHFRQTGAGVKKHAEDLPLNRGMMMEPEASVSAIVFHHPDCAYFTAEEGENGAAA